MSLEIKSIDSPDFDLWDFPCDKVDDFCMMITLSIGFSDETGGDNFDVHVYSSEWLQRNASPSLFLRSSIVMNAFDIDNLILCVNNILEKCNDLDKRRAIKNVARNFEWEFEGYSASPA